MVREELNEILAEMEEILRGLGIPLSSRISPELQVNARAKRRLGCCRYFPSADSLPKGISPPLQNGGWYVIEVSASLLETPDRLRQTICHELLHTCRGCRNHGELWKFYAARVNEALGYQIQRLAPAEGEAVPLRREEVKYVLECQSCGAKICRSRLSKAVKRPWCYRCKCGGKLKRIQ